MTLNEAIQNAEKKYFQEIENAKAVKSVHGEYAPGYHKHMANAMESRQLADWLLELRQFRNKQ